MLSHLSSPAIPMVARTTRYDPVRCRGSRLSAARVFRMRQLARESALATGTAKVYPTRNIRVENRIKLLILHDVPHNFPNLGRLVAIEALCIGVKQAQGRKKGDYRRRSGTAAARATVLRAYCGWSGPRKAPPARLCCHGWERESGACGNTYRQVVVTVVAVQLCSGPTFTVRRRVRRRCEGGCRAHCKNPKRYISNCSLKAG